MDTNKAELAEAKRKQLEKAEKKEHNRLKKIYKNLPKNQFSVAEGLIQQAARLRARQDVLWDDILENGETEMFSQSSKSDPYERERPASRAFTAIAKVYQSVIKQLTDICPEAVEKDALEAFLNDG